jgi:hypothetical protein
LSRIYAMSFLVIFYILFILLDKTGMARPGLESLISLGNYRILGIWMLLVPLPVPHLSSTSVALGGFALLPP